MQPIGGVMEKILLRARVAVVFTSETKRSFVESTHGYRPGRHSWAAVGVLVAMLAVGGKSTRSEKVVKGKGVGGAKCGLRNLPPSNLSPMDRLAAYV